MQVSGHFQMLDSPVFKYPKAAVMIIKDPCPHETYVQTYETAEC